MVPTGLAFTGEDCKEGVALRFAGALFEDRLQVAAAMMNGARKMIGCDD